MVAGLMVPRVKAPRVAAVRAPYLRSLRAEPLTSPAHQSCRVHLGAPHPLPRGPGLFVSHPQGMDISVHNEVVFV